MLIRFLLKINYRNIMNGVGILVLLLTIPLIPVYAQQQPTMNKSVHIDKVEVPFNAFNVVRHSPTVFTLQHEHATNWQVEIQNKLRYENPNGTAVIRLYEDLNTEKFIEIGMGSQPDYKFWVAVNTPEDGYFVIHEDKTNGWTPDKTITLTHSSNSGLSVSVGERTVVDQLDIAGFTIRDFTVYGMQSTADPAAVNSGNVSLTFISGDPAQNPLFYMPTIILAGTAALIIVLMKTKKRI